jgi:hypothetical protein
MGLPHALILSNSLQAAYLYVQHTLATNLRQDKGEQFGLPNDTEHTIYLEIKVWGKLLGVSTTLRDKHMYVMLVGDSNKE